MKKFLAIFVCVSFLVSFVFKDFVFCQSDEILRGQIDGETTASEYHSGGGWFAAGLGCGFLGGLLGTGIIVGIASVTTPSVPPQFLIEKSPDYKRGFITGYVKKSRSKNQINALVGGLSGTLIAVIVVMRIIR
jgi:hypothetical protein